MPFENHSNFTCDGYFDAELDNIQRARAAFTRSAVVQYVNFWPCEWNNDHHTCLAYSRLKRHTT